MRDGGGVSQIWLWYRALAQEMGETGAYIKTNACMHVAPSPTGGGVISALNEKKNKGKGLDKLDSCANLI